MCGLTMMFPPALCFLSHSPAAEISGVTVIWMLGPLALSRLLMARTPTTVHARITAREATKAAATCVRDSSSDRRRATKATAARTASGTHRSRPKR
jgi:hypothetical protein